MRGKYAGLAILIQNDCRIAVYIWCNAHRINLVINGVMTCCKEMHAIFQHFQDEFRYHMQLKRVLTTRWDSTESAVETAMARYTEILTTLSQLANSPTSDSKTVTGAIGLGERQKDIRVIMSIEILKIVK